MTFFHRRAVRAALLASLGFWACSERGEEPAGTSGETVYHVRGIIRSVNVQSGTLDVHHEEIPGYMPAMVMPFNLRNPEDAASYSPGQAIAFDFVVTRHDSWIANIRRLGDAASLQLPSSGQALVPTSGHRVREGDRVPEFELLTQSGETFTAGDLTGRQTVLTFIFTRCPVPDFCPRMSRNFLELQEAIQEDPQLAGTRLLSLTIDPEFDRPAVLSRYAGELGADREVWTFVTGDPAEINRLASAFAVHRELEGGTISHSLTTALVDRSGVVRRIWRGNFWKPEEVLRALKEDGNEPLTGTRPSSSPNQPQLTWYHE